MNIINIIFLGFALSMDAFSVSVANGLNEPNMRKRKIFSISSVFGFFQGLMPMLGWICVKIASVNFEILEYFIPYIALTLLWYIGAKMISEGLCSNHFELAPLSSFPILILQGTATSIDALSVGFTISSYSLAQALLSSIIIASVTFTTCLAGVHIGKKAGTSLSGKAEIVGGAILIFIGLEIFLKQASPI